ncbi:MAG: TIGR04282 family arsenosugar biosynthesis glycosyltransferase [Caldimonas sp.]
MSTAAIVFAKSPVAGLAKTRLIPALGGAGAARLAEQLLEHALQAAIDARFDAVELCVTPDVDHPAFRRLRARHERHGLAMALQRHGDLGDRMSHALHRTLQRHARAILIGTDAPALDAARLGAARDLLDDHDAVFVPALDGGYALVGLCRPVPALFAGVAWSSPQVMEQTRARADAAGLRWCELAPVADIDVPDDLIHLPASWPMRSVALAAK